MHMQRTNVRAKIRMAQPEILRFLAERQEMTLCTLNADGSVHAVAMWFGLLRCDLCFHTRRRAQKAMNLRRDQRVTCLVTDGETYTNLRGVQIRGSAELLEGPDRWAAGKAIFEKNAGPFVESDSRRLQTVLADRDVYRVRVSHTASWDHRKLSVIGEAQDG